MLKISVSFLLIIALLLTFTGCNYVSSEEMLANTTETVVENNTEDTAVEPDPQEETLLPELWTPLCYRSISLWEAPDSETRLTIIPLGEIITLNEWHGKYALVTYNGQQGYVLANYIRPVENTYFETNLTVLKPTVYYSYKQMNADIATLQAMYPNQFQAEVMAISEMERDIPVIKLGNPKAERHVLIQGAIHGREHFVSWLLMAIIDYSLSQQLLDETVCYHIIPMMNPDGVVISQSEQLGKIQLPIYESDLALGFTEENQNIYAQQWKANALGVDINRNFPSGWSNSTERPVVSSEKFRGTRPFTSCEAQALRDYTLANEFDATLSFHSHGSVIYYKYGNKQPVNSLSYDFALAMQRVTGYIPLEYDGTTGAGYKDWVMDTLGIPSLTLEVGCAEPPIADRDIYNCFARCKDILPAVSAWLSGQ